MDESTKKRKRNRRSKKANRGLAALKAAERPSNGRQEGHISRRQKRRQLKMENQKEQRSQHKVFASPSPPDTKVAPSSIPKADTSLRKRLNFCVVDVDEDVEIPSCPHGPCLMFARKSVTGEVSERQFVCGAYRGDGCPFRWRLSDVGHLEEVNDAAMRRARKSGIHNAVVPYGRIRRSVKRLASEGNELFYCEKCNDAVTTPHADPVVGPLKRASFRKPTRILQAITDDSREAQYWFSLESLRVIVAAIEASDCDGVLCIGAPTVFEYFRRSAQSRANVKSFLLDIDPRFGAFYLSSQFARYSMLTNYFFDESAMDKLDSFFSSIRHLAVVSDPPFGAFVHPLVNSLAKLEKRYVDARGGKRSQFSTLLLLPYFIGKHLKSCDKELEMVDYMVTYKNHPKFGTAERSVVRIFSDLPTHNFVLPVSSGYRFCEMCARYVSLNNRHCGLCGICPSKDGSTYRHCARCSRCVKPTYRHCSTCGRCHLPSRCFTTHRDEAIRPIDDA